MWGLQLARHCFRLLLLDEVINTMNRYSMACQANGMQPLVWPIRMRGLRAVLCGIVLSSLVSVWLAAIDFVSCPRHGFAGTNDRITPTSLADALCPPESVARYNASPPELNACA